MNVSLTPALQEFVDEKVASGLYTNASEVIREALRQAVQRSDYEVLKSAAMEGFSQIRAGKTVPYDLAALKRKAIRDAKSGRPINPLVTP
jgi:antitoxin ParD1/3/4